ncbi:MAG TPA: glycosyltransferase family 2 protein [Candidatus Saccharimonadales bacterium]|nr:glycosyltransferase family 2 protein [Candidatus Saccharimonadales bacterium]
MARISVVVNTYNEEKNIKRCLESVKWADEIVVVDMHSTDNTVAIAKQYTAKIFLHDKINYVEPARNFALTKAQNEWILIVDADEEIPSELIKKLKAIAQENIVDYVMLPRKNIIFGKWMQHTGWWPDPLIRFFKKGNVTWKDEIHSIPEAVGKEMQLADEKYAIIHHNYDSVSQFLHKNLEIYAREEAEEKVREGYIFNYIDVIRFPVTEFLRRYFAWNGYKDGLHGLVLSLLMACYHLMIFIHIWEKEKFKEINDPNLVDTIEKESKKSYKEFRYWFYDEKIKQSKSSSEKYLLKIKRKIS